ncbi:type III-B CRISPR module-associated Cmr3 family protein [Polyangium mundeleinium]|uniref:Type III-B CRISPR module-associated Cmr3 family protein n=1 Tax=Polyangium mundeleinium TaxID=2995306 RepID=A0ABT5EJV8_9BACT|nr:type III-B CRISPR module-associated Cmr3 family protein [Polyangium mundeleinium]MDC0741483.1 type III-B CRISPR module-associated Cmr3 family protein [Polyangium mundeleinium]
MSLVHFALRPRDGIFSKDGRGYYTSEIGRGHGHAWPLPPTIRGALRAALGRGIMEHEGRLLPPSEYEERTRALALEKVITLYRPRGHAFAPEHRVWPTPSDALHTSSGEASLLTRLSPEPPRGGTLAGQKEPALEALWRPYPGKKGKAQRPPPFWSDAAMMQWLWSDEIPSIHAAPTLVPSRRTDVHVTLEPDTLTATPSMMFSSEIVETTSSEGGDWALGVSVQLPEGLTLPPGPITLGNRRRLAPQEAVEAALFAPPDDRLVATPGLRLVLATPAHFERGVVPDGFEATAEHVYVGRLPHVDGKVVLRSALVPGPEDVSGWDMAKRAPKPTRRLVPAGSVYFFVKQDGAPFERAELRALWLTQWGRGTEDGLGVVLPGRWIPERKENA